MMGNGDAKCDDPSSQIAIDDVLLVEFCFSYPCCNLVNASDAMCLGHISSLVELAENKFRRILFYIVLQSSP